MYHTCTDPESVISTVRVIPHHIPTPATPGTIDSWFERWRAERDAHYRALRTKLEEAFRAGDNVLETWPSGTQTLWSVGGTRRPGGAGALAQPFIAPCMTPAYLAEHLTNRAQGFGTTLQVIGAEQAKALADMSALGFSQADVREEQERIARRHQQAGA